MVWPASAGGSGAVAGLSLRGVTRRFGAVAALDAIDLDVADGEFVAVLGPSGCGKTTLLRLVAGFEAPDAGSIALGGREVASPTHSEPPEARRIGLVFQSYALWPHMTVADNVGYGLKVARVSRDERARRVDEALGVVGLREFAARRPAELSGGQRQRVALARCLVTEPALVLLDEPLANLDVHLRAAMLDEFRSFHRRTGTTMVYVTHDQSEAMQLADRLVVMGHGRILQSGVPREVYACPRSAEVAQFIGGGTLLPVRVEAIDPAKGHARVRWGNEAFDVRAPADTQAGESALLCVRPHAWQIAADTSGADEATPGRRAVVQSLAYLGGVERLELTLADSAETLSCELPAPCDLLPGQQVRVRVRDGRVLRSESAHAA